MSFDLNESFDPNEYTSAALVLQELVDERRNEGYEVASGEQWIARIQDRGRRVTDELMRRKAIAGQIEQLLRDNNLHEDPDSEGAIRQAVADLMEQFNVTPRGAPLDQPCHADVLLKLANQEVTR